MYSKLLFSAFLTCAAFFPLFASPREAAATLNALPGWFEPNTGQFRPEVRFFSRGSAGALLIRHSGATFVSGNRSLDLTWKNAGDTGLLQGEGARPSRSSYFKGARPEAWTRGVQHFAQVHRKDLYPGVDVHYYLAEDEVEFDLVVAPGADPSRIGFSFERAGKPKLSPEGDLVFRNGMRQRRPVTYQDTAEGRVAVSCEYRIARNGSVTFELGPYDRNLPLVIDPILQAGYFGAWEHNHANAIAVDRDGNVWVAGSSLVEVELPDQREPIQSRGQGKRDAFLAKLTPNASGNLVLSYWTQLGGSEHDEATALTLDNQGFVYVAGHTASFDFPGAGARLQDNFGGVTDAFVSKIRIEDAGPDALWFSQFYGGTATDVANAVAVDSAGAIYIAGYSNSDALPGALSAGLQCCRRGGYDGFIAKINPDSSPSLAYGTFLGGGSTDVITAIAVDAEANIYVAGHTFSSDFPVTGDGLRVDLWNFDAFLVKIDLRRPLLDALVYGTFLGGTGLDSAQALAIAPNGDLWIGGYTDSFDFPVTANAYSTSNSGASDIFLMKFDVSKGASPEAIVYSTYLGGRGADVLYSLAVAPNGSVALAGYTYSNNFPVTDGSGGRTVRMAEAVLAQLDPAESGAGALKFSTVLSGVFMDAAMGVAVDAAGNLYGAGFTTSPDLPVTDGSSKLTRGGANQSFVIRARPETPAEGPSED